MEEAAGVCDGLRGREFVGLQDSDGPPPKRAKLFDNVDDTEAAASNSVDDVANESESEQCVPSFLAALGNASSAAEVIPVASAFIEGALSKGLHHCSPALSLFCAEILCSVIPRSQIHLGAAGEW